MQDHRSRRHFELKSEIRRLPPHLRQRLREYVHGDEDERRYLRQLAKPEQLLRLPGYRIDEAWVVEPLPPDTPFDDSEVSRACQLVDDHVGGWPLNLLREIARKRGRPSKQDEEPRRALEDAIYKIRGRREATADALAEVLGVDEKTIDRLHKRGRDRARGRLDAEPGGREVVYDPAKPPDELHTGWLRPARLVDPREK
jgi:hypothetical protein